MKIDSAVKEFIEKYDESAIRSIDNISNDIGLIENRRKINVVNLNETFSMFNEYLEGYGKYKCDHIGDEEASSQEEIKENVTKFITSELFKEDKISYDKLPEYVKSYVEGINTTIENLENVKSVMVEAGVDADCVGDVNEFVDQFVESLQSSFYPVMENILWASGYNSNKRLFSKEKKQKPQFL